MWEINLSPLFYDLGYFCTTNPANVHKTPPGTGLKLFNIIRRTFWKIYSYTMPYIWHTTSFVCVILLILINCITWLLFQALKNRLKLFNMTKETFIKDYISNTMPCSQHMMSYVTSLCCFCIIIRETFWQKNVHILSRFWWMLSFE